jgi:hypothetical protein
MSFSTTFTLGQRAMHLSAPHVVPLRARKLLPHARPIKDPEKTRRKSQAGIWTLKCGVRRACPASNSPPRSRNAAKVFLQTMNECLEFATQECIPAGRYSNVECSIRLYKPQRGAWPFDKGGARTRVYSAKNLFGGDSRFAVKFDPMENVGKWEKLGCTGQSQPFGSGVASGLMEVTNESLPADMEGVEYNPRVPPASPPPTREVEVGDSAPLLLHQPPASAPLTIEGEMRDPVSAPATPPTSAPASPPPAAGGTGPFSIPTPATTSPTVPASPLPTSGGITPPAPPIISPSSHELDNVPASFRPAIQEMLAVDPSVHQVDVLQSSSSATISSTTELANHPPGTKVTPPAYPPITFTSKSQRSEDTQYYSSIREEYPQVWETAIGTFFQEGHDPLKTFGGAMDETARQILGQQWILDYKRADDKAWEARYGGSVPSKPYYARGDLPLIQQPVYDEVVKRIRAQRNTFTTVVKHWAKTRQDVFLPMLRKAGWCEMWWNKATEDLIRWIAEEAPMQINEKCGKLLQWRVPRMWTYVVAKMQQEVQSAKV